MNYQIFPDSEWVYPDSAIVPSHGATLYAARGGDVCFQILFDRTLSDGEAVSFSYPNAGCELIPYQLLPAYVSENSGVKTHTTQNYEEVKEFVTRKAPFWVYDVTSPVCDGIAAGRAAFFLRINVALDAPVGVFSVPITVTFADVSVEIPVSLKIYNVRIPAVQEGSFHMVNWLYYDTLARQHKTEPYSDAYMEVVRNYLSQQLDMRSDYLMIPSGEPIRDADGRVVDFDFTHAEAVGNLALSMGYTRILGGFSIEWLQWTSPELFLVWDNSVEVTTIEGYRQLKLYFTRANECIERNGWRDRYMQCLMDEPQFNNSKAYRIVGAICRKCIPGVCIHDPVESSDLAGGLDVWSVKQAVFEKYLPDFRKLQEMGEEFWIYTCGFPANKVMNRVMDLPLNASRLTMWMCYKYDCKGFLHWGYHCHNEEERADTCYRVRERRFPAGNAHVVYLAKNGPIYGVRAHSQRTGAED
ncbi:MAG: DUF4091 domain-containing protein, partial [Clostridia bacterium]|nr:DUF4091 domain-containing protein [Clostridia bacterium]